MPPPRQHAPAPTRQDAALPDLRGRRVIVGVCGSIAAYKAVLLVRLLVRAGAEVRVLMTPAATTFVSELTFSTLSRHPVLSSVTSEAGWNNHVELGLWADAYVIAPATANTLAQLAHGHCDTVLAAVYLSARCPVLLAPAMDVDMWQHPATRANLERLRGYGNRVVPVGEGELASGLSGAGRLAEPEAILAALAEVVGEAHDDTDPTASAKTDDPDADLPLAGRRVLLTSGPTHEPLDPVRFIGNHSSGKMGVALAESLAEAGAEVELVYGPGTATPPDHARIRVTRVTTAAEMHAASTARWPACDAAVLAAAVADYRPAEPATSKLKKDGERMRVELVRNPDIAAELGAAKRVDQVLVGFALETDDARAHALGKLRRKRLDLIALNVHGAEASAFGGDDNAVTLLYADGRERAVSRRPKREVAAEIVAALAEELARLIAA